MTNLLKLQYEVAWKGSTDWVDLGRVERPNFLFVDDQLVFSCTIFPDDIRIWKVAIGTGAISTTIENWYPNPTGGWGRPPALNLRLVYTYENPEQTAEVLILRDFVATSSIFWEKFLEDGYAEMEFIRWL